MTLPHIVLVDGNSMAHANHNAVQLNVGKLQTQAIFGMLNTLRALLDSIPGTAIPIVLWDGRAQFRFDLFPEYKGNRAPLDAEQQAKKDALKAQLPFIELALKKLGVTQFRHPLREADDLGFYFIEHLLDSHLAKGGKVTLVTGDRDWIQLVRPGVEWFDPINDRRVTVANFLEFTGYTTPAEFVEGKALTSDDSDNIAGIAGMGPKGAQLFIAEHRSVHAFWEGVDSGSITPKARKSKKAASLHPEQLLAAPEGRALITRNLALVDMRAAPMPGRKELVGGKPTPDLDGFRALCERLHFASILRRWGEFMRAFGIPLEPVAQAA